MSPARASRRLRLRHSPHREGPSSSPTLEQNGKKATNDRTDQQPEKAEQLRLGGAVAARACGPGQQRYKSAAGRLAEDGGVVGRSDRPEVGGLSLQVCFGNREVTLGHAAVVTAMGKMGVVFPCMLQVQRRLTVFVEQRCGLWIGAVALTLVCNDGVRRDVGKRNGAVFA